MSKNTILKCGICISLLIICLFSFFGCINYIPITPDDSGETSVIQPSDESGKSVNFVVAKGEDLKDYFGETFTETVTRASQSVVSVVASYSDGKGGLTKKNASGVVLGSLDDEAVESSYIVVPHHLIVGALTVSVFVAGLYCHVTLGPAKPCGNFLARLICIVPDIRQHIISNTTSCFPAFLIASLIITPSWIILFFIIIALLAYSPML